MNQPPEGAALLRATLRRHLQESFPDVPSGELIPEGGGADAPALLSEGFALADAVVRDVAPLAMEASGKPGAAEGLRAIPALSDRKSALSAMMANEKVAHRNDAPFELVRATGGVASTAAMLSDAVSSGQLTRVERATVQLSAAAARVVAMALRAGAEPAMVRSAVRDVFEN